MVKKNTLLLLLIVYYTLNGQEKLTIKDSSFICGTTIYGGGVIPAVYNENLSWGPDDPKPNSWSMIIYKPGDLTAVDKIKEIGYYVDCTTGGSCQYPIANNQTIYMKLIPTNKGVNDSEAGHPDSTGSDLNGYTKVYEGSINWKRPSSATGLEPTTIDINDFQYDSTKNLVVYYVNNHNDQLGNSYTNPCNRTPPFLSIGGDKTNVRYGRSKADGTRSGFGDNGFRPFTYIGYSPVTSCINPNISTTPKKTINCGESFNLASLKITDKNNTNPEISYHSDSPATNNNKLSNTTVLPTVNTTYYILATNGTCTNTFEVEIKVKNIKAKIIRKQ